MDIKISRSELARGLRLAAGIAPRKPTVPILANVLLRAANGRLAIAATDLNVSLTAELSCAISKPGSIALGAEDLKRFVVGANGDDVSLKVEVSAWADIKIGKAKYRIAGHNDRDFPKVPEPDKSADPVDVDAEALYDALTRGSYAASPDESRQALCGVLLDVDAERFSVTSTDGHRLVVVKRKSAMARPRSGRATIHPRGAAEFLRLLEGAKECRVTFDLNRMFVSAGGITVSSGLLGFEYPKIEHAIPKTHKATATLNRDRLIDAIKRVAPLTDEMHGIVFTSTSSGLALATRDSDGEELTDEVDADVSGEVKVAMRAKYALDCLSHMAGDSITMRTIGEFDPIAFVDHDDDGHTGIVLPMRMN